MTRDPRVNPMPGDILRRGGVFCGTFYEVLSHDPRLYSNDVSYFDDRERAMSIGPWCEFMRGAEVIRAVGDPDRRAELAAMRQRAEKAERERGEVNLRAAKLASDLQQSRVIYGLVTGERDTVRVQLATMTTERDRYRSAWRWAKATAEKLSGELAEARRDTERLDWLSAYPQPKGAFTILDAYGQFLGAGSNLRAAIDAAKDGKS